MPAAPGCSDDGSTPVHDAAHERLELRAAAAAKVARVKAQLVAMARGLRAVRALAALDSTDELDPHDLSASGALALEHRLRAFDERFDERLTLRPESEARLRIDVSRTFEHHERAAPALRERLCAREFEVRVVRARDQSTRNGSRATGSGAKPRMPSGKGSSASTSHGATRSAARTASAKPCARCTTAAQPRLCATSTGGSGHAATCRCSVSTHASRSGASQLRWRTRGSASGEVRNRTGRVPAKQAGSRRRHSSRAHCCSAPP
jgi:ribosomal protein S30